MASGSEGDAGLIEMMGKMVSKMDYICEVVSNLDKRMTTVEKNVEYLKERSADHATNTTTYNIVENTRQSLASLVCFNHPNNMIFYGFPPRSNMSLEDSFRTFMTETLQMDHERAANMQICVQQLGRVSSQDRHSPLCVTFMSIRDAWKIQDRSKKHCIALRQAGIWAKWMSHDGVREKTNQ